MNDRILGYEWADIQRAQQGGRLSRPVNAVTWSDGDESVYQQYPSSEALRDAGYFGTADRLDQGARPA